MPSRPKPLPLATHGKQGLGKGRGVLAVLGLHLVFKEKNCTERPERRGRKWEGRGGWGARRSTAPQVDAGVVQGIRTADLAREPNAEFCQGGRQEEVSVSALRVGVFLYPKTCFVPSMLRAATQGWGTNGCTAPEP